MLEKSFESLARTIVDFARLQQLDSAWVHEHVDCPFLERFREIKRHHPGKGILIATGHLGSFELLAHCAAIYGHPLSFIVRNSKLPRVDAWWRKAREQNGNKVISRKGAFKDIAKNLADGVDVGILFDQNVTINHAVFVPWFGKDAATTKTVALAALRTEAPVIVAAVLHLGGERYRIVARDFDFAALYAADLSTDEKVWKITADLSRGFEDLIRMSPHEWFWMHRRWRTRPAGEET